MSFRWRPRGVVAGGTAPDIALSASTDVTADRYERYGRRAAAGPGTVELRTDPVRVTAGG